MVGNVVSDVFGGSDTPDAPSLSTFQLPGLTDETNSWSSLLNQNIANNPAAANAGTAQNIFGQTYNAPTAAPYQTAANNAGAASANLGALDTANANQISSAAPGLFTGASTVQNMGLDPQQALYNRTLQQVQQQSAVNNSQAGLASSPYGAGLANQATSNFNIDWQNQQLNRAISALGAAGTADTAAAGLDTTAGTLGAQGVASTLGAGQIPYDTSQTIAGNNSNALTQLISTLNGANSTNQMSLQDILQYLTLGSGQSNAQANLNQTSYQDALKQSQAAGAGLGSLFSNLGTAFGLNPNNSSFSSPFNISSLLSSMGTSGSSDAADSQFLEDAALAAEAF